MLFSVMQEAVGAPYGHYIRATRINAVTGRTVTGILCNFWVIPNSGKAGAGSVPALIAHRPALSSQGNERLLVFRQQLSAELFAKPGIALRLIQLGSKS